MRSGTLVRRRQLARILRELRLRSGLTIEETAPKLDFSASKLSRIENAHQAVDVHVVRTMMDIFGVDGDRWNAILDLTREANAKGWWRAYGLDDQGYVPLEAEASAVREYTCPASSRPPTTRGPCSRARCTSAAERCRRTTSRSG
jgi:transcriptional regulator with XRE-family HTH domain